MPRLKLREVRKFKKKPYNLNKLIGVNFNETNNSGSAISAFPREAWYNFEQSYDEQELKVDTARFFHNLNLGAAANIGNIYYPNSTDYALCLNTLESNYNPTSLVTYGGDKIQPNFAPFGAKLISDMYTTYRVTSCYFKFNFALDVLSMNRPTDLNSGSVKGTQYCKLRVGVILTKTPGIRPTDATLVEAINTGHIRTVPWTIGNETLRGLTTCTIDGKVNIIKQFDNDDQTSVDSKDTTRFAARLGNGGSSITSPLTRLYVIPFIYLVKPWVGWDTNALDGDINFVTKYYVNKTTIMSGPVEKAVEVTTGDPA